MEKSMIRVESTAPALRDEILPFRSEVTAVAGHALDLAAFAKLAGGTAPMKISAASLEQYLNASNPVCSG